MISVRNLSKYFQVENNIRYILNDVSLEINEGEFGIITGRSGAGKSTLLHLIAGLDTPSKGECWIGEESISSFDEDKRAEFRLKNIGFVFQTFNFLSSLTISENIMIPKILLNNDSTDQINSKIVKISNILGINHILNQLPNEVSGGELQRACIARAMINHPAVILADEPTGNLDTENRGVVVDSFNKMKGEFNVTILMVTHDEEIEENADTIFHLNDGIITKIR
ncbi:ABC transporter ATP-binding protein [Desulfobacterota bacterium AH_259_B03_O07]|nr:ABC transporter ATP-binding protein [Desulfobacterota bacterium AH_259_B03_O07]